MQHSNPIVFTTETGSRYLINYQERTVERLSGAGKPTPRVGEGVRRFETISPVIVGSPACIYWGEHTEVKAVEGTIPVTLTSRVVAWEEVPDGVN